MESGGEGGGGAELREARRGTARAFLREKGLHEATLPRWKAEIIEAMKQKPFVGSKKDPQQKRIAALERELRRKEAALLVLKKKRTRCGGGKGRGIALVDRLKCRDLIEEAVGNGARLWKACEVIGITMRTYQRWGRWGVREDGRHGAREAPANRPSEDERQQIVALATSRELRELAPCRIVPILAKQGMYVASESSFYRVLRERKQLV